MSTGVRGWDKATCGEREVRKAGLWIHRRWEQWAGRIPQVSATELGIDLVEQEEEICKQPTCFSGRCGLRLIRECLLELGAGIKWQV